MQKKKQKKTHTTKKKKEEEEEERNLRVSDFVIINLNTLLVTFSV